MAMIRSSSIRVQDPSGLADARRLSIVHAERLGWNETDKGNVAIIATELASNQVKHARDGLIAITSLSAEEESVLHVISVDRGPGMTDPLRCFEDGFSTGGSPGTGLGAVQRLAYRTDLYSTAEGTVLVAEMRRDRPSGQTELAVSGFAVPKEGEEACGDGWDCRVDSPGSAAVLVCDGLGHGAYASEATTLAMETFRGSTWCGPQAAMAAIDLALRSTRGAAAAVASIDTAAGKVRYCGIGNITAAIVADSGSRHLVSQNGILGHGANRAGGLLGSQRARMTEFEYPWSPDSVLVLHSDGISARWQPDRWHGLWSRLPATIAGVIYRDLDRGNDDAVAVVVRQERVIGRQQ